MAIFSLAEVVGATRFSYDVPYGIALKDWEKWRYCYEGGDEFRRRYLERFSNEETDDEFERRARLTPIPTFAKRAVNKVKNSIARRLRDVDRKDGTRLWKEAVAGVERGVDRQGSSMTAFLAKKILAELLVMSKVGILIEAPRVPIDGSQADVPRNFSPYLKRFRIENVSRAIPAPAESPSDWVEVLVTEREHHIAPGSIRAESKEIHIYYYLDPERGGLVTILKTDLENGGEERIETQLDAIPFVLADIDQSLIEDACTYQIVMMNMISADSNYAIDTNYSFLTRQRGNDNAGAHMIGDDDSVKAGTRRGMFYDKGRDRPAFIAPPAQPMAASLKLRQEMKEEVDDLVGGAIADIGADNSIEAGLAAIGQCLQDAESRVWDHWAAYESFERQRRRVALVSYPDSWDMKSDEQRINEAQEVIKLTDTLVGVPAKKEASKMVNRILYGGRLKTQELDRMNAAVDSAPCSIAGPGHIINAKKEGVISSVTAASAFGCTDPEGEAERVNKEHAMRAATIVAAQSDASNGAGRGADDMSVNQNSESEARRDQGDADLSGPNQQRGEGADTDGDRSE